MKNLPFLYVSVVAILVLYAGSASASLQDVWDNGISYFDFEQNTVDVLGNYTMHPRTTAPSYNSTGPKVGNYSVRLTDADDSIRNTSFQLSDDKVSIDFWFQKFGSKGSNAYVIHILDSDGNPRITFNHNAGFFGVSQAGGVGSCSNYNVAYDNDWHHWVIVVNETSWYVYMDGVPVHNQSSCDIPVDDSNLLFVGGYWSFYVSAAEANGNLDGLMISDYVYTPQDVLDSYNGGSGVDFNNLPAPPPPAASPNMTQVIIIPTLENDLSVLDGKCAAVSGPEIDGFFYHWYNNSVLHASGFYDGTNVTNDTLVTVNRTPTTDLIEGHNWTLGCKANNSVGNSSWLNSSVVRIQNFSLYDEFGGETTDFNNVSDITNVTNATIESVGEAKIIWMENVDAQGVDFNDAIQISSRTVKVNVSELGDSFNVTAEITFYDAVIITPVILVDGERCDYCTNVTTDGQNVTFVVPHFTTYTVTADSNMTIWDDTDPEGGSQTKVPGNTLGFYANYTFYNGTSIDNSTVNNGTCYVTVSGSTTLMDYNTSRDIWQYEQVISTGGTVSWSVDCNASTSSFINSGSDSAVVEHQYILDTRESCQGTQQTIFAGLLLVVLIGFVASAWAVVSLFSGGNVGTGLIVGVTALISLGIITFIGYIIIYYVGVGTCIG